MISAFIIAMAVAGEPAQTPAAAAERPICRRYPITGSRVRFNRVCMTQSEWDAQRQANSRGVQEYSDRNTSVPGPGSFNMEPSNARTVPQ